MGIRKQFEKNLLQKACSVLQETEFSAEIIESAYISQSLSRFTGQALTESVNVDRVNQVILEIDLHGLGDRGDNQLVQISFLPATEELIEITGFNTLQLVCFISENLPVATCNDLARTILRINPKIVAGAFNIDEQDASFFYKSSAIITNNMDEDIALALIQVQTGIFLSNLDTYNDVIMDIIEGLRTADEAIQKGII